MKVWEAAVNFGLFGVLVGMVFVYLIYDHQKKQQIKASRKAPVSGYTLSKSLTDMVGIESYRVKSVTLTCEPSSMAELTVVMYTDWTVKEGIEGQVRKFALQEKAE